MHPEVYSISRAKPALSLVGLLFIVIFYAPPAYLSIALT